MRFKIRSACFAVLQALVAFSPCYAADPDEVIVHFRDASQSARLSQTLAIQSVGALTLRKIPNHGNIVLLKKAPGESMDDFLQRLRSNPDVLSAEPNRELRIPDPEPDVVVSAEDAATMFSLTGVTGLPNDPLLTWGYWDIAADQVPPVTGEAPMVAVIDTGVDYTHPELAGRVVLGHDFHNDDDDPMDDHGHGTHVSGIVAAEADNGQGSAGVSPGSRILALKVLGADGSGSEFNVSQAVYAAADHPDVRVINLSLGSSFATAGLANAFLYAVLEQDKLMVVAAGNNNTDQVFYPARWSHTAPGVIGVAANDEDRCKASFSNYGVNATIAAPGVAIWSTLPGNQYASWSGTSMATPFVSGAAARLLAKNPALTNVEMKSLLESNGDSLTFDGSCWPVDYFEHLSLVQALDATPGLTPDNAPPDLTIESPTNDPSFETEQATIEVAGIASDNIGVSRVTWSNDTGGAGTATGTTAWAIPDLVLEDGENVITVTAHDAAGNQSSQALAVNRVPPPQGGAEEVLTLQVDESSDDGYEVVKKRKTVLYRGTTQLGIGLINGYRFDGVALPANAQIISATLSQYGPSSASAITVEYTGEAAGDPTPFSAGPLFSQRPKTLEAVTDDPGPWTEDDYHPSPNLGAIIQELVTRSDWQSGHAINLFVEGKAGKGGLVVNHFDGDPNMAALLEIRFRRSDPTPAPVPAPDNEAPQVTIDSPASGAAAYETEQDSIEVNGTASDNIGVSHVSWTSNRGGTGTAEGTASWTIPGLALADGENIITVTAHDAAGNSSSEELTVMLVPQQGGTEKVLLLQIDAPADDAYEVIKKKKVVLNGSKVQIGVGLLIGYHFDGISIPQNALIVSTTLSQYGFRSGNTVSMEYTGEAVGDAAVFSTGSLLSQRPRTLAAVTDDLDTWPDHGYYPSPDLSAIVQELVSRADWQSGDAVNLFVEAKSALKALVVSHFDHDPNAAATLEIRYRVPD